MVNKFGDHSNDCSEGIYFHPIKKVVHTKGKFKDYKDDIIATYRLGVIPYRETGTTAVPVFAYDNIVYCLGGQCCDSEGGKGIRHHIPGTNHIGQICATEKITDLPLAEGDSLVTFKKGEQGDEPVDAMAFKGDIGSRGPVGSRGKKGDTGANGVEGERGEQGVKGEVGPKGEKGDSIIYRWFGDQVLRWFRENENCCFYFSDKNDFIWTQDAITGLKSHTLIGNDAISVGDAVKEKTLTNGRLCIAFKNSLFKIPNIVSVIPQMYTTIALTFHGDKIRQDKQYILTSSAKDEHAVTLTANKLQVWGSTQDPIEFDHKPNYWNHVYIQWTNQGDRKGHVYYGNQHKEFTTKMWDHQELAIMYVGAKPDKQSPFYGDLAMLEVKTVSRKPDEKALPNEIRKLIIENHKVWVNNPLVDKNFV